MRHRSCVHWRHAARGSHHRVRDDRRARRTGPPAVSRSGACRAVRPGARRDRSGGCQARARLRHARARGVRQRPQARDERRPRARRRARRRRDPARRAPGRRDGAHGAAGPRRRQARTRARARPRAGRDRPRRPGASPRRGGAPEARQARRSERHDPPPDAAGRRVDLARRGVRESRGRAAGRGDRAGGGPRRRRRRNRGAARRVRWLRPPRAVAGRSRSAHPRPGAVDDPRGREAQGRPRSGDRDRRQVREPAGTDLRAP